MIDGGLLTINFWDQSHVTIVWNTKETGDIYQQSPIFLLLTRNMYTLVGPTVTRLVQDPLAVTRLENRLYILDYIWHSRFGLKTKKVQIKTLSILANLFR